MFRKMCFEKNYQHFENPHPLKFMRFLFRAKRGENFLEVLTISCAGGCRTHAVLDLGRTISCAGGWQNHGILDLGRRVEQRWPYYFLCRRTQEDAEDAEAGQDKNLTTPTQRVGKNQNKIKKEICTERRDYIGQKNVSSLDIVTSMAPVSLGVQISQSQLVLKASLHASNG